MSRRANICAILLLAGVTIAIQAVSGAYASDFTSDEDEAAHAVSSLAVHDYITRGFPGNPIRFGENYYIHYPKVSIGHWPPLFYVSEAAWMIVFGRTRAAMIAFVGVVTIALLISVFWWVQRDYGAAAGLISALVLAAPPFMQSAAGAVAPNALLALLAFWAAVVFGEYLDRGRRRDAAVFVVLVLAAMGVHGRGAALAFLPVAILFTGRFAWTRIRVGLLIALIAIALVVPRLLHQAGPFGIEEFFAHAGLYIYRMSVAMSWPVAILAVAGVFFAVLNRKQPQHWLAMPALVLSGWIFHSIVNAGWGDRYLVTAAPAVAALAGAGFHFCTKMFPPGAKARLLAGAIVAFLCGGLALSAFPLAPKRDLGYHRMATVPGRVELIAGDPFHEGAFVSEMALRDNRLDRIVLRGYKALAEADWTGGHYRLRFSTPAEVLKFLDQARVELVLMQVSSRLPHVAQLREALHSGPASWREVHLDGQPAGVAAFERTTPLPPGDPIIRIDMHYSLGRILGFGR